MRILHLPMVAAVLCVATASGQTGYQPTGRQFYVSPTGTPLGNGTPEKPWDLGTALAGSGMTAPGDTIWLLGGVYQGAYTSNLTGAPASPIVVRGYPGQRVTIDSAGIAADTLTVLGSWTWFWGFEIMNSYPQRIFQVSTPTLDQLLRGVGVNIFGHNVKCIDLVVHDTSGGFGFWTPSQDSELYGNIIYFNGWDAPDRGHGHGIYTQNETGTKAISDNFIFDQFGYGIHAYSSSAAYLNGINIEGNVLFNNGSLSRHGYSTNILIGGGRVADNDAVLENYSYFTSNATTGENNLGYLAGCSNMVAQQNYFAGNIALALANCSFKDMSGNTFIGALSGFSANQYPNNVFLPGRPTQDRVAIRPHRYDPRRAHIVVFNWTLQKSVVVDPSGVLKTGDEYDLYDVQNYFGGPVVSGTWNGAPISIPMSTNYCCDLNGDGSVDISDIQIAINQAVNKLPCTNGDVNRDGSCDIVDVQLVINAFLMGAPAASVPVGNPLGNAGHTKQEFGAFVLLNKTPAAVSQVKSTPVTAGVVNIAWITDIPANSRVEYGTSTAYGEVSPVSWDQVVQHNVALTGINPGFPYHFRVRSIDLNGREVISGDQVFP